MPPTASAGPGEPPTEMAASGNRRLARIGILGAAVAFLGLSLLTSLTIKPFQPADESSNVDYALSVSQWRLPLVDQRVVQQLPGQRRLSLNYVANHPPLYYLVAGVPLRLGLDRHHPMLGFYAARVLTALLAVGAVVLTGVLAFVLDRRRRPAVAVGAAALLATSGSLVLHASIIHNDLLALTFITAELIATVLVLRQGLRTGACLLLVAAASLALLTRISAVSLIVLSAAALVAAGLLHPVGGRRRALVRSLAWVAALVAACLLTSGWFYWHNTRLYGDPTGQAYVTDLVTMHSPPVKPSVVQALLGPDIRSQPWRMFGADAPNGLPVGALRPARYIVAAIGLAVIIGLLVLARRFLRDRQRPAADRRLPPVEVAVAALLALHVVAVGLQLTSHLLVGGYGHVRYVFAAWPVVVLVMAYALWNLPGRLGRALLALVVLVQAALTVTWLPAQAARWTGRTGWAQVLEAVRRSDVPAPDLVVAVLAVLIVGGLGMAIVTILRADGRAPRVTAAPEAAGSRSDAAEARAPASG